MASRCIVRGNAISECARWSHPRVRSGKACLHGCRIGIPARLGRCLSTAGLPPGPHARMRHHEHRCGPIEACLAIAVEMHQVEVGAARDPKQRLARPGRVPVLRIHPLQRGAGKLNLQPGNCPQCFELLRPRSRPHDRENDSMPAVAECTRQIGCKAPHAPDRIGGHQNASCRRARHEAACNSSSRRRCGRCSCTSLNWSNSER